MLIREFCLEEDYAATIALWQACNILLSKSDSRESIYMEKWLVHE
jgi:hypothetical protein